MARSCLAPVAWIAYASCWLAGLPALADDRPNVVLIVADDAGYNEFGFSAASSGLSTEFLTPNIDSLAAESTVFTQAYVSSPICSPSRAALLTGQYQSRFGYEANIAESTSSMGGLRGSQVLMTEHLKSLGYTTGVVGKWHVGAFNGENRPVDQGVDEFYGFLSGSRDYWGWSASQVDQIRRNNTSIDPAWRFEGDASRYDPTLGRYLTDALGEESADFIDRHATDEEPFFLYVPMSGPHAPMHAKESDLAVFSHIENMTQRTFAAMNYAMDRAVGDILNALEQNNLDDNTIVIFTNDNGGTAGHDNSPFQGSKGYLFEGGIRVPMAARGPGFSTGVSNTPVTFRDLAPTFVAAAGGDLANYDFDGVDIVQQLQGGPGVARENLFWRHITGAWAVREGDLKLTSPAGEWNGGYALFDVVNDPGETVNLAGQYPELVDQLLVKLGYWEAQQQKPSFGAFGASRNQFDHFILKPATSANSIFWHASGSWLSPTGLTATLSREDSYANAIIEFGVNNNQNYTTVGSVGRMTRQHYMFNEIRLTGEFTANQSYFARLNGEPIILTPSLEGVAPKIRLEATSAGTTAQYRFEVRQSLRLMGDLEITGDGTQLFDFRFGLHDYDPDVPAGIVKTGQSVARFHGANTFSGPLLIQEGGVTLESPSAAINNQAIVLSQDASLTQFSGTINTGLLDATEGGYALQGGSLAFDTYLGHLQQDVGTVSPNRNTGPGLILGDYTQGAGGVLRIDIEGDIWDILSVSGDALLDGTLDVSVADGLDLTPGVVFPILTADTLDASGLMLDAADSDAFELFTIGDRNLLLRAAGGIAGDYNLDGTVDSIDYAVWRTSLGQTGIGLAADGSGPDGSPDGVVDDFDFQVWLSNFGHSIALASDPIQTPEPSSLAACLLASTAILCRRRKNAAHAAPRNRL